MLSIDQANEVVRKQIPNGKIEKAIKYKNLYLFMVFTDDPGEEEMDPYFSVDQETGEFKDFPIFEDEGMAEILSLFMEGS